MKMKRKRAQGRPDEIGECVAFQCCRDVLCHRKRHSEEDLSVDADIEESRKVLERRRRNKHKHRRSRDDEAWIHSSPNI